MDNSRIATNEGVDQGGDAIVVDAHGDIDMASSVGLHARLTGAITQAPPGGWVIADLTDVTFCDSQGIRALVLAHNLAHGSGRNFGVRSASPNVESVLRVAGVFDLLTSTVPDG